MPRARLVFFVLGCLALAASPWFSARGHQSPERAQAPREEIVARRETPQLVEMVAARETAVRSAVAESHLRLEERELAAE